MTCRVDRRCCRFLVLATAFSNNTVNTYGGAVVLDGTARFQFERCTFSVALENLNLLKKTRVVGITNTQHCQPVRLYGLST